VSSRDVVRYRLVVHYDGTPFHGWQLQRDERTVQGEIEGVLRRITGARRPVIGSGRTDRGVHAAGQVASVDVPLKWTARKLRAALNALLPDEIWIEEVRRVPKGFHPRFHASRRSYLYRLGLAPRAASPFHRRWCWDLSTTPAPPDPGLLRRAADMIPGERSFRKFAKAGQPERGDRCRVHEAEWSPWGDLGWVFRISADRYLHHMVRYLVGTMVEVARGERAPGEMRELLESPGTDLLTSPPAPPEGLLLSRVEYDPDRLGDDPDRDPEP
jgi:tRNA pseudouridine38-40 synthase